MNTAIVKLVPQGDFEAVSVETHDEKDFLSLINQQKGIKYQTFEWPNLSKKIQDELSKRNYIALILASDHSQYFLVPR